MGLSQQEFYSNHAWKVEEKTHEAPEAQAPQDEAAQQIDSLSLHQQLSSWEFQRNLR